MTADTIMPADAGAGRRWQWTVKRCSLFLFMINPQNFHEAIVVGAGPAGIAAAIRLSQLGVECLVLEKAGGPREKPCGGAVSPAAAKTYAKLGFSEPYFLKNGCETDDGWIRAFGIELHGHTKGGKRGFLVERRQLDWDFQQFAISQHAVRIEYGAEVFSVRLEDDSVIAQVRKGDRKGPYSCRFLIAADGAASIIRTRLSGRKIRPKDMILTSSGVFPSDRAPLPAIRFHEEHMPAYSWVFPCPQSRVNVGIGIYADVYEKVGNWARVEALVGSMQHPGYAGKLSRWIINTNPWEPRVYRRRVFLAGDAGGFADAFTGEGISFALRSGMAAAAAIARARRFGGICAISYMLSMAPVVSRLIFSKALQRLLTRIPAAAKVLLRSCEKSGAMRRLVFRYFSNS